MTSGGRLDNVVEAEDLTLNPVNNIANPINEVPGIYMHSGTLNTNRITIRGVGNRSLFSTTKLRAYIDDIPLTNGVGESTIEDFDIEILNQLKIYKGPGASAYGAGLGGLIKLKTNNDILSGNSLKSKVCIGAFGHIKTNQTASFSDKTFAIKLHHSYQQSDGYRENNNYKNNNYTALAKWIHDDGEFNFLYSHINLNAQIPSSLNEDDYNTEPTKAAFTWGNVKGYEDYTKVSLGVGYKRALTKNILWHNSIYHLRYNGYELRPFNILEDNNQNTGIRSHLMYAIDDHEQQSLSAGLELSQENYNWNLYTVESGNLFQKNEESRKNYQFFSQYKNQLTQALELQIGFNLSRTTYVLEDKFDSDMVDISGSYDYSWIFSPRVNLTYQFGEDLIAYGIISHGSSTPSLEETLTPEGIINVNIKPEIGWNYEIGIQGNSNDNKIEYGASLYWMEISDLLVARRTAADQFIGLNAGGSRHIGLELDAKLYLIDNGSQFSFIKLGYGYQHHKFTDFIDLESDFSGNQLTGSIPHQVSISWNSNYKGLSLVIKSKYIDAMPLRDDNSIYSEDYFLVDAYGGYTYQLGAFTLNHSLGVNNVLDTKYASMLLINAGSFGGSAPRYYYPGLPINLFGQTSIKYNF